MGHLIQQIWHLDTERMNSQYDKHNRDELFDSRISILQEIMNYPNKLFSANFIINTSESNCYHLYSNLQLLKLRLLFIHLFRYLLQVLLNFKQISLENNWGHFKDTLHYDSRRMFYGFQSFCNDLYVVLLL